MLDWFSIRSSNAALRRAIHAGIGLSCSATAIGVLQGLAQKMDFLSPVRASSLRIPVNGSVYGKERQCVVPPSMHCARVSQWLLDVLDTGGGSSNREFGAVTRSERGDSPRHPHFCPFCSLAAPHPECHGRPLPCARAREQMWD